MGIDVRELFAPLLAGFLPFVRILAFLHFCPVLDQKSVSRRVRVAVALALTAVISPMLHNVVVLTALLSVQTFLLVGEQILWGFMFGAILQWVFIALQTAGHILSFNMGLGMAVMNDPGNGVSTTVIAQMIFIFCVLMFFSLDGHLLLVTILYKGFTFWPIGHAISDLTLRTVVSGVGWLISGALLLAMPTVFIMMIVQGVFGLLNRVSPALNLFSLGFPISMLFGLFCIGLLVSNMPDHYLHLTNDVLAQLDRLREA
ncbi:MULTISPECIES: flagellar biosynthetic protein FliR [Rahnella]|uniref:Flagellar biosynthetic protein FliR n=1 Tax=Rahnella laticis TaxID=2787622 RepID=A0ABS0E086_9GAMM|nr:MULTISPECIES: flagellar biosynthetic protein FliR [Rahnella]MBF7978490.1 flagellar biosynthetic protein FliR [Rahnella laticis]MBF7998580.1 flagellar biosynthetic protein FliR [Rahnella sp. LAC-M12]